MNNLPRPNSVQFRSRPVHNSPVLAPDQNRRRVWPGVMLIFGLISSFVWVAFLVWCLWKVFRYLVALG
jgi:hypothetical protein